eukprot:COSAG01_NODE_174_length_23022_cov_528.590978_2_plen_123_part_00
MPVVIDERTHCRPGSAAARKRCSVDDRLNPQPRHYSTSHQESNGIKNDRCHDHSGWIGHAAQVRVYHDHNQKSTHHGVVNVRSLLTGFLLFVAISPPVALTAILLVAREGVPYSHIQLAPIT